MPVLELSTLTLQVDAVLTPAGNPRREGFFVRIQPISGYASCAASGAGLLVSTFFHFEHRGRK